MRSAASPGWHSCQRCHAAPSRRPPVQTGARFSIPPKRLPKGGTISRPLDIGYSLLRDLLLVLLHGPENEVTNVDILPRFQAWAAGLGLKGIELLKSGLDQAYRLRVRNINQQLGFETLGLEVSSGVR